MAQTYFYHNVSAFVLAGNPLIRQAVRSNLYTLGCRDIRHCGSVREAEEAICQSAPDLLILEQGIGGSTAASDMFRRIRHGDLGSNPFIALMAVADKPVPVVVRALVDAGADDVLPFPWPDVYMDQRMANLIHNRKPFVVTSDYVGPDRRKAARAGEVELVNPFHVPNPLKAKALDRTPADVLDRAVQDAAGAVNADKINRLAELVVRLVAELSSLEAAGDGQSSLVGTCLDKLAEATRGIISRAADTPFAPLCTSCRTLHRSARTMRADLDRGQTPALLHLDPQCRTFMREFRINPRIYAPPPPPKAVPAAASPAR